MITIIDYLQSASTAEKTEYDRIRDIVLSVVPDAEETISYGMPTFKYKAKSLLHFGVFKDHLSLFPGSGGVVGELGEAVQKYRTSKGTLQYQVEEPIPRAIVEVLVRARLQEITN